MKPTKSNHGVDLEMQEKEFPGNSRETILPKVSYWMEYYSAAVMCLTMYSAVYGYQWIGPALLKFKRPETYIEISSSQALLLSNMYQIANIPAQILSPILNNRFGRRNTLVFTSFPIIFAQIILIYQWPTVYTLYVSRGFTGFGTGIVWASLSVYLSEISSANVRGMIGTFMVVMTCVAEIVLFVVVPKTSLQVNCIVAALPPILLIGLSFTVPESPYYYVMRNRDEEAKKSLQKLRSRENVDDELANIAEYLRSNEKSKGIKTVWTEMANRKSLFIVVLIFFTQPMVGTPGVATYGQVIMDEVPTFISAEDCGIVATVAHVVTVLITCLLIDRCGRRPLLFWSTVTTIGPCILFSFYFYCRDNNIMLYESIHYFPFLAYLSYKVTTTFGLTAVAFITTSEIFPTYLRAFVTSFASIVGACFTILSVTIHSKMTDSFGNWQIYVFYILICILGGVLFYLYLPETKCQTLEEIQDMLTGKSKKTKKENEKKT